ncbi:MAG TPA: hypothetical protein PLR74_03670, partial [Agriterribacter sp.]|nr:hypothetical protein [Agriterribacter sp.]
MKQVLWIAGYIFFSGLNGLFAQEAVADVDIKDLHVRDPYIVAHQPTQTYYLYKASMVTGENGEPVSGVVAYRSR